MTKERRKKKKETQQYNEVMLRAHGGRGEDERKVVQGFLPSDLASPLPTILI